MLYDLTLVVAFGVATDDWRFRLATMVQMVGVIVVALGVPQMFASIDHGDTIDTGVMVAGSVVMRAALVPLWALVARHDPAHAPAARTYITIIAIAQARPRRHGIRTPSPSATGGS